MFDKPVSIKDTINSITGEYNTRQVDIDTYKSFTNELRLLKSYSLASHNANLVAGVQLMNNNLHRKQLGKGTTGSDYNLSLVEPGFGRDLHFKTHNMAVFAENSFEVSKTVTFNAGFRVESGETDLSGTITNYPENDIPVNISHQVSAFRRRFFFSSVSRT